MFAIISLNSQTASCIVHSVFNSYSVRSIPAIISVLLFQWFYAYLYTGSILFISAVYVKVVKEKAVDKIVRKESKTITQFTVFILSVI